MQNIPNSNISQFEGDCTQHLLVLSGFQLFRYSNLKIKSLYKLYIICFEIPKVGCIKYSINNTTDALFMVYLLKSEINSKTTDWQCVQNAYSINTI